MWIALINGHDSCSLLTVATARGRPEYLVKSQLPGTTGRRVGDVRETLQARQLGQYLEHNLVEPILVEVTTLADAEDPDMIVMSEAGSVECMQLSVPGEFELPMQDRSECSIESVVDERERGQLPAVMNLEGSQKEPG